MDENQRKLIRGTLCIVKRKHDNRYLLRFETKGINANCWIFPGGDFEYLADKQRIELGVECAARETQEETGISPQNLRLRAIILFDNKKRIFPGKTEVANFNYQGIYYYTEDYIGEFREVGPDGRKQGWFNYDEAMHLPMHPGDKAILKALETIAQEEIFEGVIVHNIGDLESATFQLI
jgi:8-oxo-dGTP pyrophosphatase MutT (NUDIX family)